MHSRQSRMRCTVVPVSVFGLLGLFFCTPLAARAAAFDQWQIETVDATANSGHFNSLAVLPSGNVAVAYRTEFGPYDQRLRWVERTALGWQIQEVESGGYYVNLRLDPLSGHPALVHGTGEIGPVRYVWHDGAAWQGQTVQSQIGQVQWGQGMSLRFTPSGEPTISYNEGWVTGDTHYARRSLPEVWDIEIVHTQGALPGPAYTSQVILPSGTPAVSFTDIQIGGLRYARYNDQTHAWDISIIDQPPPGATGQYVGLGVDMEVLPGSGRPAVAYYHTLDMQHALLKYAWYDGDAWQHTIVDDTLGSWTDDASLAILPNGEPAIAYADGLGRLKFAWHDAGGWQTWVVASNTETGWCFGAWNSLEILPNGFPAISFRGGPSGADGDMMVAFGVPEPTTLGLFSLGAAGMLLRRRRA